MPVTPRESETVPVTASATVRDDELTIALAEYAQLAELRRSLNDQSSARFNFYLVVATAVAAVSAGLLSGGDPSRGTSDAKLGAVGALGVLTLIMGMSIFVRLVEFSKRGQRYSVAQDALRTYLSLRAPGVAPYILMPTLGDNAIVRVGWGMRRDAISLPGTVALLNSMLLALAGGLITGRATIGWPPAIVACTLLVAAYGGHLVYLRRALSANRASVDAFVRRRGLLT